MNNLREDSLFKFYNLSIKSAYTHISHVVISRVILDFWFRVFVQKENTIERYQEQGSLGDDEEGERRP